MGQANNDSLSYWLNTYSKDYRPKFHPDHIADLAKSQLNQDTITTLRIHTIPPAQISKHLGYNDRRIQSLLCFPYPGLKDFCRDKIFPPLKDRKGHMIKYLQRKGSGVHLYIPMPAAAVLHDTTKPLIFTEGEKKAAKACQQGYATIGLGGLWNWIQNGKPIDELDQIDFTNRATFLIPDSDAWQRNELARPVTAFGHEIQSRGARLRILKIPGN